MRLRCKLLCFTLVLVLVLLTVVILDPLIVHLLTLTPRLPVPPDLEVEWEQEHHQDVLLPINVRGGEHLLNVPSSSVGGKLKVRRGLQVPKTSYTSLEESGLKRINEATSEKMALRLRVPEMRHSACASQQYSSVLPSATVIICFHNEPWSSLLRTLHSVLDTASQPHMRELILVDDLSQDGQLKAPLSNYISRLEGVRLIRSKRRLGVVGCRMLGATRALGEVLVFLDSHCECHPGWLEPLLQRIKEDRSRVTSPVIDHIDPQTFQYEGTRWPVRGVFDWKLDFHWDVGSQQRQNQSIRPILSPVLAGILAIDKNFFQKIGAYDPGMVLWGLESIELSIRVWLCGGSMEVVPCSRVGHVQHLSQSYSSPDDDIVERNKIRVAETWLGPYRKIFYRRDTLAYFIQQSERPNCTERLKLHEDLGCKSFHWYLSNVHPDRYIPQDRPGLSGELYNVGTGYCADYKGGKSPLVGVLDISPCTGDGNQHCELTSLGEVRWGPMGQLCLGTQGESAVLSQCGLRWPVPAGQQWRYTKEHGRLVHLLTQKCLEAVRGKSEQELGHASELQRGLSLRHCSSEKRQQWLFEQLVVPAEL